jgi:secondary thiamine-phosphate synthase enzyme
MPVLTVRQSLETRGNNHAADITSQVAQAVTESSIDSGTATIFVTGSTAGITTIEFEPGCVYDLDVAFERLFPRDITYRHHERWGDDNGHSHIRAAMLGPSMTVPFEQRELLLGTWQQIILVDFDTRPRTRNYVVQIVGE